MIFRVFRDNDLVWTIEEVQAALDLVSIRGCMDLGWRWVVKPVDSGFRIGALFSAPDRDTLVSATQFGRDYYLPFGATVGAVVKTAFLAAKVALEHELLEAFHVGGVRPFDPHAPVVRS